MCDVVSLGAIKSMLTADAVGPVQIYYQHLKCLMLGTWQCVLLNLVKCAAAFLLKDVIMLGCVRDPCSNRHVVRIHTGPAITSSPT